MTATSNKPSWHPRTHALGSRPSRPGSGHDVQQYRKQEPVIIFLLHWLEWHLAWAKPGLVLLPDDCVWLTGGYIINKKLGYEGNMYRHCKSLIKCDWNMCDVIIDSLVGAEFSSFSWEDGAQGDEFSAQTFQLHSWFSSDINQKRRSGSSGVGKRWTPGSRMQSVTPSYECSGVDSSVSMQVFGALQPYLFETEYRD